MEDKHKHILSYCCLLTLLILALIFTIIPYAMYKSHHDDTFAYQMSKEIEKNWNQPFISDIVVTSSGNCPATFEKAHEFTWPGTVDFCSCPFQVGPGTFYNLHRGTCSQSQLNNGCSDNPAKTAVDFNLWRNSKTFCYKTISTTFLSQSKDCPASTHQFCANGDQTVCVPQSDPCPLSFAATSISPTNFPSLANTQIDNNFYLHYGLNPNKYPLVRMGLGYELFCALSDKKFLGNGFFQFSMMKKLEYGECKTDPEILYVDAIGEEDFYTLNSMFQVVQQIPGYPRPTNLNLVRMGAKEAIAWSHSCRMDDDYNMNTALSRMKGEDEHLFFLIALILVIVAVIVCAIIMPLKDHIVKKKGIEESEGSIIACWIIDLIIKILAIAAVILALWVACRNCYWFKNAISNNCSSKFIDDNVLGWYEDLYFFLFIFFIIALICLLLTLIHDIIYFHGLYKEIMAARACGVPKTQKQKPAKCKTEKPKKCKEYKPPKKAKAESCAKKKECPKPPKKCEPPRKAPVPPCEPKPSCQKPVKPSKCDPPRKVPKCEPPKKKDCSPPPKPVSKSANRDCTPPKKPQKSCTPPPRPAKKECPKPARPQKKSCNSYREPSPAPKNDRKLFNTSMDLEYGCQNSALIQNTKKCKDIKNEFSGGIENDIHVEVIDFGNVSDNSRLDSNMETENGLINNSDFQRQSGNELNKSKDDGDKSIMNVFESKMMTLFTKKK